jgi:hypothetical protein
VLMLMLPAVTVATTVHLRMTSEHFLLIVRQWVRHQDQPTPLPRLPPPRKDPATYLV